MGKTRMHEIIGVEPMQASTYRDGDKELCFYADRDGVACELSGQWLTPTMVALLVNYPQRIIHKPCLSPDQRRMLETAQEMMGAEWIAVDDDGEAKLFLSVPEKLSYTSNDGKNLSFWTGRCIGLLKRCSPLTSLTTPNRPVEIGRLLKDSM